MKPTELTSTGTEVLITVRGEQYYEGMDPDATELVTEGLLIPTEDGILLRYEESALTGMEGTTTTFALQGRQVILTRSGSVNSQMVFEHGVRHTSLYETPYGELTVDISTSLLENHMTPRGGTLEIRYSIAVEHTVTGRNLFSITVKER